MKSHKCFHYPVLVKIHCDPIGGSHYPPLTSEEERLCDDANHPSLAAGSGGTALLTPRAQGPRSPPHLADPVVLGSASPGVSPGLWDERPRRLALGPVLPRTAPNSWCCSAQLQVVSRRLPKPVTSGFLLSFPSSDWLLFQFCFPLLIDFFLGEFFGIVGGISPSLLCVA